MRRSPGISMAATASSSTTRNVGDGLSELGAALQAMAQQGVT